MIKIVSLVSFLILVPYISAQGRYYIKQCYKQDEEVNRCLQQSTNYLIANIKRGIPELGLTEPEPIIIDEIQLALGSGPDGYRATFRNIKAYGVSNVTVTAVRSDIDSNQFQFTMYIPKISARAVYESSGILILVPASGGGNYWGEYEGVKIKAYLKGARRNYDGRTYLSVQQMKMDFSVKDIRMGVDGIHNGNSVIQAALNLFINSNSQELLKEMKPSLKKKLLILMRNFAENIFSNVPYDEFLAYRENETNKHIMMAITHDACEYLKSPGRIIAIISSYIHVCHKEDPNLVQCMMASVEDIRPFLVDGVPEHNIPRLEPLVMQDFFAEEYAGMKVLVSNVTAHGCTDFFVREMDIDLDTYVFTLYVDLPKLRIEAHYSVDGKLLLLPVKGNGNLEANVTDCVTKVQLRGELYEKDGETYLKYNALDLHVDVGGGHVRLENLFNGDKLLLGMINDVVNKNLDAFLKELMPIIERALESVFLETANAIVEPYTYKQLFPH